MEIVRQGRKPFSKPTWCRPPAYIRERSSPVSRGRPGGPPYESFHNFCGAQRHPHRPDRESGSRIIENVNEGSIKEAAERMREDWDRRARENARYYVATGREQWDDAEFFRSGEQTVSEEILTDMINICQGKDPKDMRVLEIGCGAGRVTRALSKVFGEVHAVDI